MSGSEPAAAAYQDSFSRRVESGPSRVWSERIKEGSVRAIHLSFSKDFASERFWLHKTWYGTDVYDVTGKLFGSFPSGCAVELIKERWRSQHAGFEFQEFEEKPRVQYVHTSSRAEAKKHAPWGVVFSFIHWLGGYAVFERQSDYDFWSRSGRPTAFPEDIWSARGVIVLKTLVLEQQKDVACYYAPYIPVK